MKLYTIKFANGRYLSRIDDRTLLDQDGVATTANINEAYIYYETDWLADRLKGWQGTEFYQRTLELNGGSSKLIEVKIAEVANSQIGDINDLAT